MLTKREAEMSFDDFINNTLKVFFNPNSAKEATELLGKVSQLGICSEEDMKQLKNIYESLTDTKLNVGPNPSSKSTKIEIKDGSDIPPITNISDSIINKKEEAKSRLQSFKTIGIKEYNNCGNSLDKMHLHSKDVLRKTHPWSKEEWQKEPKPPKITNITPETLPNLDSLTKNSLDRKLERLNLITEVLDKALELYTKLQDSSPATEENRILERMFSQAISTAKYVVALNRIKFDPKLH